MANRCYLNAIAQVSCQRPLSDEWFDAPILYDESYVRAQEPDTKGLIDASESRRMSKILKRSICTALTALNASRVKHPDAIITGTGMGCMENSEKFLVDLGRYGESCLKPTLFMQSTHNTISSLVAILLRCHGYNNTYSHKGISFESALLDAWLQIRGGGLDNALVGSHDEVTPFVHRVMRRTHPEYSFVSEASVSAVLTQEAVDNICEVVEVRLFHKPELSALSQLLEEEQDDVLLLGVNGNATNDEPYERLIQSLPYRPIKLGYKHIFGDNFSSSALSFYVGSKILERQRIPKFLLWGCEEILSESLRGVTILNHSDQAVWSLIRLKRV